MGQRLTNAATAEARTALAGRLYKLAQEAVVLFRNGEYERLFAALVKELPACTWQRVRVNPADQGLAQIHFADAQIVGDEAIVAGMDVEAEHGRIRINNTLEKRLQRAWPDILPDLIVNTSQESSNHQPPT